MERTSSHRNVKVSQKPISVTSINLNAQMRKVSQKRFNRSANNSFAADQQSNLPYSQSQHLNQQKRCLKAQMQLDETERVLMSSKGSAAGVSESLASTVNRKVGTDFIVHQATTGPLET